MSIRILNSMWLFFLAFLCLSGQLSACEDNAACQRNIQPAKSQYQAPHHLDQAVKHEPGLCAQQDLSALRRLSIKNKAARQFAALYKVLHSHAKLPDNSALILQTFADCWQRFLPKDRAQYFPGLVLAWQDQQQLLNISTHKKQYQLTAESTLGLPKRAASLIKRISKEVDGEAVSDSLWFLLTEATMAALNNEYESYVYADELVLYTASSQGRGFSVGFMPRIEDGNIFVKEVYDEALTAQGLQSGDHIESIHSDAVSVEAKVEWWLQREPFEYTLQLKQSDQVGFIKASSIPRFSYSIESHQHNDLFYLRIGHFNNRTGLELSRVMRKVDEQVKGIVIDLRNNPGGSITPLAVDYFVKPAQKAIVFNDKSAGELTVNGSMIYYGQPLVILQNRYSVSMAEIMSAMLQQQQRATVIGENSYGKSVGQTQYAVGQEGVVLLVTTQYFYPDGENHWGEKGVEPDVRLTLNEDKENDIFSVLMQGALDFEHLMAIDPQLQRAVEILGVKP